MGQHADDLTEQMIRGQRPYDPFFDGPKVVQRYYWTTKLGEQIPITKLKTSHLQNIVNLINRKGDPNGQVHILQAELDSR